MITLDKSDIGKLLDWFSQNGVQYPWADTSDPYSVWVSEVMLQQTTVAAVLPRYRRWMQRFPGTAELARAEESEVLREWEGLGYYNRARNLASAAREIETRYNGRIPDSVDELRKLPGVGSYIGSAIAGFAFGRRTAAIDANGRRIAMRLSGRPAWNSALEADFRRVIEPLMPDKNPGVLNGALMQLGQIVCTPRKPRCKLCPLASRCRAYSEGIQNTIPKHNGRKITEKSSTLFLLVCSGRVVMKQKDNGIGAGLWVFPDRLPAPDRSKSPFCHLIDFREYIHHYTRYRETLLPRVFGLDTGYTTENLNLETKSSWLEIRSLEQCPMPAVYRKIARELQNYLNLK